MNVANLIKLLKKCPQDSEVCIILDSAAILSDAKDMGCFVYQAEITSVEDNGDDYVELGF